MPASPIRRGDSKGYALFITLLAMVVLSLAAAAFMMSVNVETKVAGHDLRASQALNFAEAGVSEAIARIRTGDIPNNGNPRMVAQIYLAIPGQVPALGADSIGLATEQPAGQWLNYSTDRRSERALTIHYKTDAAQTKIYRYDATKNPTIQTSSGLPIFVIESTGRKGLDRRKIVTELVQKPFFVSAKAALAAEQGIDFSGNSDVCGYNHSIDTPAGTKGWGPCSPYHVGAGNLAGGWSTKDITSAGSSTQYGSPALLPNQANFYAGPWDVLGMSQADFYLWVGTPFPSEPNPPRGIVYLDNNQTGQDASGSFAYQGGDGEGLLYVDGDLAINGGFTYRGLIYIEGNLQINGTCWILGGIIVKGKTTIKIANGDCTILYSSDAISQNIAKYGGQMVTLSWIETH
jgi:Tfp pilus assembly protein PilX